MPEVEVGIVSDFFARPVVAGIDLTGSLKVGDNSSDDAALFRSWRYH